MLCQSIRFNNGKRSEGLLCRIAATFRLPPRQEIQSAPESADSDVEESPGTGRRGVVSAGRRTRRSSPAGCAACARATRRSSP